MIECRVTVRLLGILAGAAMIAAMPLRASQAANKPAVSHQAIVARLLQLGEHYSPTALAASRAYHDTLRAKPGYDARIQYAFVLVLIRQHCRTEAVELLDKMVEREPDGLHLWRAKIWAEMAVHKERAALSDIRSVADVLARQTSTALPESEAESQRATAEFLGRVFGFLEIPRANAPAAEEVRSAKQYLLARLGDQRADFDQSEELVAEKFAAAREAFEEVRAKRVADGISKQQAFEQQQKLIDETETNVDYDTEKVKTNTVTEVERHNRSAESLRKYLVACQFRLDAVHKAILTNQGLLAEQALASEQTARGTNRGNFTLVDMARSSKRIQDLLERLVAEEIMLVQQIKQLSEQLQTTLVQRDALLETAERTTAELKTQAAALKRDEKRLERAQQTEAKKIAAQRQKTLLTKQTSFATFEPFPLDTETQRLLGTAKP
ncbi:MAG TPA: hypothetical protein VHY91_07700 [Pirellulales bacterium]|jgi:hypothetical protein|nr:hypothetical protein [Pirellulales bacterium]